MLDIRTDALTDRIGPRVRRAVELLTSQQQLVGSLDDFAARVGTQTRQQWARQLKAVLGVDLIGDPDLGPMFDEFRATNVELITSLAEDKLSRIASALADYASGTIDDLPAAIQDMADVTESRARLIAHDQTMKLAADVSQARHQAAGVNEFTWSTSRDERVRDSHAELEGQRFSYNDPPFVDGEQILPGDAVNCRCEAIPIIEGFDD